MRRQLGVSEAQALLDEGGLSGRVTGPNDAEVSEVAIRLPVAWTLLIQPLDQGRVLVTLEETDRRPRP